MTENELEGKQTLQYRFATAGEWVQGTYVEKEVTDSTRYAGRKMIFHIFRGADGMEFSLLGHADLNRKLLAIPFGTRLKITWLGLEVKRRDGRPGEPANKYSVVALGAKPVTAS